MKICHNSIYGMTKIIERPTFVKGIGTFQVQHAALANLIAIQLLDHLVFSLNVGILRCSSEEIIKMLKHNVGQ